jgi:hypothetical protein
MIIALNLVISIYYRLDAQFMIIASNLVIIGIFDAAIYDYRLEPCDIDIIIALTRAAIYDYRLEPGDIDIIIALTHRNLIIASNLVLISILLSP